MVLAVVACCQSASPELQAIRSRPRKAAVTPSLNMEGCSGGGRQVTYATICPVMRARRARLARRGASTPARGGAGSGGPARPGRPGRPRDERIDAEVVAAVLRTLTTRGYSAVTIEGIARKVKRARSSLYRRWPSKRHLVAYAVLSELGPAPAPDTGRLAGDLGAAVRTLHEAFAGPLGPALAGLVGDMAHDAALARMIREEVLLARRTSMRRALARA